MGTNTLDSLTAPHTIIADDFNQYFTALTGNFVPRNASSGAPETAVHSLGTAALEWKNLYANNIFINGQLFDPDAVGAGVDSNFAIVSGAKRSTSDMPDFLRASGSGASMTILATTTPLQITANGTSVTIEADIAVSSLTVAPAANNTCLVNDTTLTDQETSKYTGETFGGPLTIDTVGTEISARVGQYICLKASTEYMLAYVESATSLTRCYRGFFFNSSGNPVVRETLANNDTLTIMSLGWVFMDSNGTTVDVSYRSPYYSGVEPASPATDDYWFDMLNRTWKRYDGADFQEVNRVLIGLVVIDGTNCVATRSADFTKVYSDFNELNCVRFSNTQVYSTNGRSSVSVYGVKQDFLAGPLVWDITTDLESGVTEGSSTTYYLYVSEDGKPIISDLRPHNRLADLGGYYHPFNSWRCVATAYNDSSSNIAAVADIISKVNRTQFDVSGTWIKPPTGTIALVRLWGAGGGGGSTVNGTGGGGGGAYTQKWFLLSDIDAAVTVTIPAGGATNTAGGNATFGSYLTAYGGGAGNSSNQGAGGGGGLTSAGGNSSGTTSGAGGGFNNAAAVVSAAGIDAWTGGSGGSSGKGGDAIFGGGGGGSGSGAGGSSVYGGGGGAGGSSGTGGTSVYSGNGGGNGVAGTAPAGGGGKGAAGAAGRCIVYVF